VVFKNEKRFGYCYQILKIYYNIEKNKDLIMFKDYKYIKFIFVVNHQICFREAIFKNHAGPKIEPFKY